MRQRERERGDALVYKLVGHHQGDYGDAELAAGLSETELVALFEAVDVMEREDDDALADLSCLEQLLHKVDKVAGSGELEGCGACAAEVRVAWRGWGGGEAVRCSSCACAVSG